MHRPDVHMIACARSAIDSTTRVAERHAGYVATLASERSGGFGEVRQPAALLGEETGNERHG